ncbi:DHH family phosphoesterase [Halalkalirubrum salinum]|uniref:DHH family phosphoesterase n=1 Tax=Halalkalirubrum salinum TaxID=2563889 RepID=UPI0010FB3D66|nr:DHHA1 domain-containing protein [Halalkalirubrum salinum]
MGTAVSAGERYAELADFVQSEPALVFAGVVFALGLIAAAYLVARWRRPKGKRFAKLIGERDEITILMHPNPDPDAMSAAMGVAALAEQFDTESTIQYAGQIRHQENRAFQTVLDLEFDPIDHVTDLDAEDVVLVDHNEPRGFTGADGVLPIAVVDHHPGDGTGEFFTDVRTDYGASASIIAEYFRDIGATPVPADRHASETRSKYTLPSAVATGLLCGILTDTNRLTIGATAADFDAAAYLYPGVDDDRLDRITNPAVDAEVLEVKARAIAGRKIRGSFAVCDVGSINNADAIPQAADELIRLEGVTAVVICGERNGTLHISGRSRDDRVHMGRALENAVEHVPNAGAGGHARMGGGTIQLQPGLPDGGETSPESQFSRDSFTDRLFKSLAGDV